MHVFIHVIFKIHLFLLFYIHITGKCALTQPDFVLSFFILGFFYTNSHICYYY